MLHIKYLWSHCSTYFLKYPDLDKPHTAAPMTLKETKRPNKVQAVEQVPAGKQKGRIFPSFLQFSFIFSHLDGSAGIQTPCNTSTEHIKNLY